MKRERTIAWLAIAAGLALAGCQAGRDGDQAAATPTGHERTILFEAPGISGAPRTRFSDDRGLSIETIWWGRLLSSGANATVDYWHQPLSSGFLDIIPNVSKLPDFYMLNKEREVIVPVGDIRRAGVAVGDVYYVRARAGVPKDCVIFQTRYKRQEHSSTSKLIQGWYCTAFGEDLSDEIIHSALASLGIEGWRVP